MKRQLPLPIFVIALVIMLVIASTEYVYLNDKVNQADSGIHITGSIKIYQGNTLVRDIPDAIQNIGGEDAINCYIFNSTQCSNVTNEYGSSTNQIGTACQYWKGSSSPTLTNGFYSNSICNFTSIALSTDNSPISTNTGCPILTASALAPVHATTIFQSGGINIAQTVLTASFSPTGTQTINKMCIIPWNSHSNTYSTSTCYTLGNGATAQCAFAIDAVSPAYTTTNDIPFTVQWTFTLTFS